MTEQQRKYVAASVAEGAYPRLFYAARYGFDELVEEFLDEGDDVNFTGRCRNALAAAANENHLSTVRLLLRRGVDANDARGDYSAMASALFNSDDMARLMIDAVSDVDAHFLPSDPPLHCSVLNWRSVEIIAALIRKGVDVLTVDCYGRTALDLAKIRHISHAAAYLEPLTRDAATLPYVLDVALAFAPMRLPPYVVLEIVNWLSIEVGQTTFRFADAPEIKKVQILVGVQRTQNRLLAERGANKKGKI